MKRKLLFAIVALLCSVGSWAQSYSTTDLESAGWTKVTTTDALSSAATAGNYFVLIDAGTSNYAVTHSLYLGNRVYYQATVNPCDDAGELWNLEPTETANQYNLRNVSTRRYPSGWDNWMRETTTEQYGNCATDFSVSDGRWTLKRESNEVGPWNNDKAVNIGGTTEPHVVGYENVAANKASGQPGFYVYTISASDFLSLSINGAAANNGKNVSFLVKNPGFETGDTYGWTLASSEASSRGACDATDNTFIMTNSQGYRLFNTWPWGQPITQEIASIPNGRYKLQAVVANSSDGDPAKVYLLANNDKNGITCNVSGAVGVEGFVETIVTDNSLTIGAVGSNNDADRSYIENGLWWFKVDNFRLYYYGNAVEVYSPTEGSGLANTWYSYTVASDGYYKISSEAAATIRYTQNINDDADTGGETMTLAANGYTVLNLTAGTFYFKSNASGGVTIEALSATNGTDVTSLFIENPSFETGNNAGWSSNAGIYVQSGSDLANKVGTYYEMLQGKTTNRNANQTVKSPVPAGKYILSVNARANSDAGNVSLNMSDNNTPIPVGVDASVYTVAYETAESASPVIKFAASNGEGDLRRCYFDNFILTYYTELPDVDVSSLTSQPMDASVRSDLTAASTTYNGSKTVANYNSLQTAIVNAKVSIAEFAAKTGADADWTNIINNPSFETGYNLDPPTGWNVTVSSGSSTSATARFKDGGFGDGGGSHRFFIWTQNAGAATVSQTLYNLPAGDYKLSNYMASGAGTIFTLTAGSTFKSVTANDGNATLIEVYFSLAAAGNVTIRATCNSFWFDMDNFHLTKDPTMPESLTPVSGYMSSTVATSQTTAIATYESDKTMANLLAAQTAMNNAVASVQAYKSLQASIDSYTSKAEENLDDSGQTSFASSIATIQTNHDNGSYSDSEATGSAITSIKECYIAAVKAQTTPGSDMTDAIIDPSFENSSTGTTITGWTTTNGGNVADNNNWPAGKVGAKFVERWHASKNGGLSNGTLTQTLTAMPAGIYKLTVNAQNIEQQNSSEHGTGYYATLGSDRTEVSAEILTVVCTQLDEAGNLTIGMQLDECTGNWISCDDFHLTYVGSSLPASLPEVTGLMNADVKTATNAAINTYNTTPTLANYKAAEDAIVLSDASKAAYASANLAAYKDRMGELLATTNVYTTTAYDKWYANVDENYVAGVYTDDEVELLTAAGACQSATETAHKKANLIDDVLLSSWTIGGQQCSDYTKDLYINTWSTEGNGDGSGFQTPFFEYWIGDAYSLRATTIVGTVTGLEPGETYNVHMWARVRQTNNQTKVPESITLQVGNGTTVYLTDGTQVGSSQFYHKEYTATGTADGSGNLTITITVAENSNVSWLSFKNVKYAKVVTLNEDVDFTPVDIDYADVSLTRTVVEGYNSVVLPFNMTADQVTTVFGDGAEVYEFSDEYDDGVTVNFNKKAEATIAANTPVLVKAVAAIPATLRTITDVTIVGGAAKVEGSYFDFVGNYTMDSYVAVNDYYISQNKLFKSKGTTKQKVTRAFLQNKAGVGQVKSLNFFDEGEATSIHLINADGSNLMNSEAYDLSGRVVKLPTRGLYIINGKKVLIK